MFTLEESSLLRRMVHTIAWIVVAALVTTCVAGVRWVRHHHQQAQHAPHST